MTKILSNVVLGVVFYIVTTMLVSLGMHAYDTYNKIRNRPTFWRP